MRMFDSEEAAEPVEAIDWWAIRDLELGHVYLSDGRPDRCDGAVIFSGRRVATANVHKMLPEDDEDYEPFDPKYNARGYEWVEPGFRIHEIPSRRVVVEQPQSHLQLPQRSSPELHLTRPERARQLQGLG